MEINISVEVLAELLNKQPGEISEALTKKEDDKVVQIDRKDAEKFIKDAFSEHVKTVKSELRDEGYGRGKKEALTILEKSLSEKYGVDIDQAEKMIDKIIQEKSKVKADDPEKIKQSEVYINAIREEIEKREKIEGDFRAYQTDIEKREKLSSVKSRVSELLEENNFVLPENTVRRKKLLKAMYNEMLNDPETVFDLDGDEVKVLNKEGKPKRNDNLKELSFKEFALNVASTYFDVAQGDDRKSPGNKKTGDEGGQGGGSKTFSFAKPASKESAMEHLHTIQDVEEKKAYLSYMRELEKSDSFDD